jgi:hypothetical protein
MLGVFRPLEEYVDPSIVTVGALFFVSFLDCVKIFFGIRLSFVEHVSTIIWIIEFYYLD